MSSASFASADSFPDLVRQGADWTKKYAPSRPEIVKKLRREARIAQNLTQAGKYPATAAVYGASQAGKSYLVSTLTAPEQGALKVLYGEQELDFLRDMNPEGGGESSGLVTRFTVQKPQSGPFPEAVIPLRLLSAREIICIAGDSFFRDFQLTDEPPSPGQALEELQKAVRAGQKRKKAADASDSAFPNNAPLDQDDIEALEDYFCAQFRPAKWFSSFQTEWWRDLAEIAPWLTAEETLEALSPLWGKTEKLGKFTQEVFLARLQLPASPLVWGTMEALTPREWGILNVKTLISEDPSEKQNEALIPLVTADGKKVNLSRRMVSALIAELIAPLPEKRWDFQSEADVLDFPGARSRSEIRVVADSPSGPELFLRGKVAHLFESYLVSFDITAMLLCIGPSNQEVKNIPALVTRWINERLGATSLERQQNQANGDGLFLILTKFDETAFEQKSGSDDDAPGRWNERIRASITNFFNAGDARDWLENWYPNKPFANSQWLRNPTVGDVYLRAAGGSSPETDTLNDSLKKRLPHLERGYAAADQVSHYFAEPEKAFNEAMRPNDGGVSWLAGKLLPLFRGRPKESQIAQKLEECAVNVRCQLKALHHDEDEDPRKDALEFLDQLRLRVSQLTRQDQGRFVAFLRRLTPARSDMKEAWGAYQSGLSIDPDAVGATGGAKPTLSSASETNDLFTGIFGEPEKSFQQKTEGEAAPLVEFRREKKFIRFARQAIAKWTEKTLNSLEENPEECAYYGFTPAEFRELVDKILHVGYSFRDSDNNLDEKIARDLRAIAGFTGSTQRTGEIQAIICQKHISDLITAFFYPALSQSQRERLPQNQEKIPMVPPEGKRPIFYRPDDPIAYLEEICSSEKDPYSSEALYARDWLVALYARLTENGPNYDRDANQRLGSLLERLKPSPSAAKGIHP